MTIKNQLKKEIKKDFGIDIDNFCPKNDLDAWQKYPNYNFLYNKMFICKIQNLKYAPMPILPKKFPVVIKPITNLMGMGLNSIKITSKKEFIKYFNSNHFWCEFITGEHLSWDLLLINGIIKYVCCFKGFKNQKKFGTFKYWKFIKNINTPNFFFEFVDTYLKNFSGCINLETINNKIIECHLRMGDIDQLPKDHLRYILYTYINKNDVLKGNNDIVNIPIKKNIFLIPIWQDIKEHHNLDLIYEYLEKNWEQIIIDNKYVNMYYFDQVNHATPGKFKRWFLISTNNYKKINLLKSDIENDLKQKFI